MTAFTPKLHHESTDVQINGTSYEVAEGQNKAFWENVNAGKWEPQTFDFFRQNIGPDSLVVDVGAWIGPTALYAAQLGARCVAFEPDPVAFVELKENYCANGNSEWISRLSIFNTAISVDGEPLKLGSRSTGGDSMSSALFSDGNTNWVVPSRRLDDVLQEHAVEGMPVFIKIDIEGGEYTLVPKISEILSRDGLTVHLSLHPTFFRKALRKEFRHLPQPFRFLAVRCAFTKKHCAIIAALPVNKVVKISRALPAWALLFVAALTCRFPKEIRILPKL